MDEDRKALYAAAAQREIARLAEIREAQGTEFMYNGLTFLAADEPLAQADFPLNQPELGRNAQEKDPRMLTALPPDFPKSTSPDDPTKRIRANRHILLPAWGDPAEDRYRVESLLPIREANVTVGWKMLVFTDPEGD